MKKAIPDLVTVGFGHSAKAYSGADGAQAAIPPVPMLANHHYAIDGEGNLAHSIEGRLRAIVAPKHMREYGELWPDALPLIKAALGDRSRRDGDEKDEEEKSPAPADSPMDRFPVDPAKKKPRKKKRGS